MKKPVRCAPPMLAVAFAFALLLAAPVHAYAQLPVTGARTTATTDTARSDSTLKDSVSARSRSLAPMTVVGERARSTPPPVARIEVSAKTLQHTPAANAYDLVRRVTGLEVHEQGQGPGFTSNAVIRGFNSDHSADVLLVVDGVPINSPIHGHVEGFADWNVLLPAAVSTMRVIHGTASPLYGDFSLAGVVEVFSATDADRTSAGVTTSSFGDAGGWISSGRRGARGGSLFALDAKQQQGWQNHSTYQLGNGLLRGWRTVAGGRLEGGLQLYRSQWDSPGFVSIARYNTHDLRTAVDSTDGGDAIRTIGHLRYARSLGRLAGFPLSMEVTGWGQAGSQRMFLNVPGQGLVLRQSGEEDRRSAAGGQVQAVWQIPLGEIVLGVSGRADRSEYELRSTLARATSSLDHSYDGRFQSIAAFIRWRRLIASRLALDVGARVDQLHYEAENRVANTGWRQGNSVVASPKLGARYFLPIAPFGTALSMLASTSHGFRGAVGVIDDPTRPPFLAWSHEVGVEAEREGVSVHAAFFRIDTSNERIFNPVTLGISSAGRSRRQGFDARATWNVPLGDANVAHVKALDLFGAFTWNDAKFLGVAPTDSGIVRTPTSAFHDHNVPIYPGDPVPGIARFTGRVGAELPFGMKGDPAIRVSYRLLGSFTPIGEPGVYTRTASVLDVGASVSFGLQNVSIDLDLQNVLNLRFVENRASGFVTPGVPRVLRAGLRLR